MTTKERKTIQNFINKLTELEAEQDKAFKELQNLNVTCGDGDKWCCLESNLKGVLDHGTDRDKGRAEYLYRKYFEAEAKMDVIRELGGELAALGFWKN